MPIDDVFAGILSRRLIDILQLPTLKDRIVALDKFGWKHNDTHYRYEYTSGGEVVAWANDEIFHRSLKE